MAKSNSEVAQAFVMGGKVCKGSNTAYDRMTLPVSRQVRTFTSYSTVVAVITEGTLWWMDYKSSSTHRQLRYIFGWWANANEHDPAALSMCVRYPTEGASNNNVHNYVFMAEDSLDGLLKPRIRMPTKVALWGRFLRWMDRIELLLTLPCYASSPTAPVLARVDTLRRIRDSNAANPAGLDETIIVIRAVHALEGN